MQQWPLLCRADKESSLWPDAVHLSGLGRDHSHIAIMRYQEDASCIRGGCWHRAMVHPSGQGLASVQEHLPTTGSTGTIQSSGFRAWAALCFQTRIKLTCSKARDKIAKCLCQNHDNTCWAVMLPGDVAWHQCFW
jgi:hypothetical protein